MTDIRLELTLDETNLILEALGKEPFVKVHGLISKVRQQAQRCLEPPPEPVPVAKEDHDGSTRNDVRLQDIFPDRSTYTSGPETLMEPEISVDPEEASHAS